MKMLGDEIMDWGGLRKYKWLKKWTKGWLIVRIGQVRPAFRISFDDEVIFYYFQNSIFWPPLSWLSHQSYFSISFLISSVAFFSFLFFFKEKKILFNFENVKSFMADNKCQFTYEWYFVAWRKYKWKLSLMTITLLGRTVFRTKILKKCLLDFLSILW